MLLTNALLTKYIEDGLLLLPDVFSENEISALVSELDKILVLDSETHVIAESGEVLGTTVMHKHSTLYEKLIHDERLVSIAEQILGGPVYVHQYKVILKEPFGHLSLPWHQDYGPWHHHDGMPKPKAISFGIFLDDVNEFNGPIVYMPESHSKGLIPYQVLAVPGTTPIPSLTNETVAKLAEKRDIVSPKGPAGSVTLFDCCTAHASGMNISPLSRRLIYLSYNLVTNAIEKPTRADHFASREFNAVRAAPAANLLAK